MYNVTRPLQAKPHGSAGGKLAPIFSDGAGGAASPPALKDGVSRARLMNSTKQRLKEQCSLAWK
jgi:hypothetical protein